MEPVRIVPMKKNQNVEKVNCPTSTSVYLKLPSAVIRPFISMNSISFQMHVYPKANFCYAIEKARKVNIGQHTRRRKKTTHAIPGCAPCSGRDVESLWLRVCGL